MFFLWTQHCSLERCNGLVIQSFCLALQIELCSLGGVFSLFWFSFKYEISFYLVFPFLFFFFNASTSVSLCGVIHQMSWATSGCTQPGFQRRCSAGQPRQSYYWCWWLHCVLSRLWISAVMVWEVWSWELWQWELGALDRTEIPTPGTCSVLSESVLRNGIGSRLNGKKLKELRQGLKDLMSGLDIPPGEKHI